MKRSFLFFMTLIVALSFTLNGCKKDDDDNNNNNNNNTPSNPTPSFNDSDAVLAAIRVNSTQTVPVVGTVNIILDGASSAFFDGSNYHDAGEVKVNTKALTKYQNNSYAFISTTEGQLSYDTGNPVDWSVAGSSSVTGFTHTTTNVMVQARAFASSTPDNVDIDADVTLSLESFPTHATDVMWVIIDKDGNMVTKTNSSATVTFAASELSTLTKGANALIQVAAYNYSSSTYGGKKVYFVNETATTKSVTLD